MADVSVVVPVHADAEALPTTLPAILRAARRLAGRVEIVVVATPAGDSSRDMLERLLPPGAGRIIDEPRRGKFRALRTGVRVATAPCLVLVDADVLPDVDAFRLLLEPLARDDADVCLPRRIVATDGGRRGIPRLLCRWAVLWADAWHRVRQGDEFPWILSGDLYAIRRELFPERAAVPVLDDVSVGHAAWMRGARFRYVQEARVEFRAPSTVADWLRQKLRTRRGFARFARLEPEVARLQGALIRAAETGPEGRSPIARTLVAQERLIRLVARLIESIPRRAPVSWSPVATTKRWARPPG